MVVQNHARLNRGATPARVMLGVTTVLTMTTLISSTNASLPKISYVKSIDAYLAFCFFMVFASLIGECRAGLCWVSLGAGSPVVTMSLSIAPHTLLYVPCLQHAYCPMCHMPLLKTRCNVPQQISRVKDTAICWLWHKGLKHCLLWLVLLRLVC